MFAYVPTQFLSCFVFVFCYFTFYIPLLIFIYLLFSLLPSTRPFGSNLLGIYPTLFWNCYIIFSHEEERKNTTHSEWGGGADDSKKKMCTQEEEEIEEEGRKEGSLEGNHGVWKREPSEYIDKQLLYKKRFFSLGRGYIRRLGNVSPLIPSSVLLQLLLPFLLLLCMLVLLWYITNLPFLLAL